MCGNPQHAANLEALEHRRLLHAVLSGGTLTATGIAGVNNFINVSAAVVAGVQVLQVLHSTSPATAGHPITQTFPAAAVTKIVLNGAGGNDQLTVAPTITKPATLNGNAGNDILSGGGANDVLNGSAGADQLRGNNGNDSLSGGDDADMLFGLLGADKLGGGNGVDIAFYNEKTASLTITIDNVANDGTAGEADNVMSDVENVTGGGQADKITGSASANQLDGGAGNDTLDGGGGNDKLLGNAGNDRLLASSGADDYNGGGNNDTVDYGARATAVNVSIDNAANDGTPGIEFDNVRTDVEIVIGGSANDVIVGSSFDNRLIGSAGNDILRGGAGDDVIIGGLGNDQMFGDDGDDVLMSAGGFPDTVNGGNGFDIASVDTIDVRSSIELIV